MSKADISTTPIRSRRAVLAGMGAAAALPIVAAIPTAAAEQSADPIFAAMTASREAQQEADRASGRVTELNKAATAKFGSGGQHYNDRCAYVAGILGVDQDEYTAPYFDTAWDAHMAFAETEPTTLAGLFAMLIYAGEIAERGDRDVFNNVDVFPTVAAAATHLSKRG